ncbi:MAG: class I SAM-dependent methyltransferase [Candidatus Magasanikbacteria bacterium]|jgi:SAM-dependent methyltransferase
MVMTFLSAIVVLLIFLLVVMVFSPLFLGVPFLPTHKKQAIKMIELAQIKTGTKVVDLGSGAGRLLFLAAKSGAQATGYELNPFLVLWTRMIILLTGQRDQIKVFYKSIYDADIKDVDVILMFLFPPHMKKMIEKLKEAKPGTIILSYAFALPEWQLIKKEQGIYVYKR